ncbi:MAG: glycosyltransferase [Candidatus Omnitrophica bacterium]|nr:glycosyltransferase [Candidatus Omnitrophota bacterium]
MRVAFIVGKFPSLSETFILNQMTGLLDQGHMVRIFAGERSSDVMTHEDVIRSGLLQHTRYYCDVPRSLFIRYLSFPWHFFLNIWRAPGVILKSLNVFRFGKEAASLELFFKALVFLDIRDYDVILCHFGHNGLEGLRMKEIGALQGKLVTAFHTRDITSFIWKDGRNTYKKLFEESAMILPVSRYAKGKLIELGCPEQKINIHHMGVDLSQFDIITRRKFGSLPMKFLSVAYLVEKKGIRYALEALALLMKEGIVWEYTIIGDGPLRSELGSLTRSLGIVPRVRFMGWQDSGAVRRALKDSDVFLAPSIKAENGDEEGIPVVLMEAMATRVPVITTPTGSIRELVEDGKTGFLVPEKNAKALAQKIVYLYKNPKAVDIVSASGRSLIEQEYNVETLNKILVKILS